MRAINRDVASVRVQLPLRFVPVSEPEPDIAIVPAGRYTREHPTTAMLVIEVARTSLPIDLGTKAEIYAAAEVPEYWVVDIPARTVHVHASPGGRRATARCGRSAPGACGQRFRVRRRSTSRRSSRCSIERPIVAQNDEGPAIAGPSYPRCG